MEQIITIKNMVCNRCITVVLQLFNACGFTVKSIQLGQVVIIGSKGDFEKMEVALKENGFEVIKDENTILVEKMKAQFIQKVERNETEQVLQQLAEGLGKDYSFLSKLFSQQEGVTLEHYFIQLKIEKVKELIQLGKLNFSEIAYEFNYKTSSHLAKQFKKRTGMSMSEYKKLQDWDRRPLDQIV